MLKKWLPNTEKALALLTIFLIPSQLAYHLWPSYAFVFGIRVDYLAPTIFLTDLTILGILFLWFLNDKRGFLSVFKNKIVIFGLLSFALINTAFSTNVWVSLLKWMKILEFLSFGFFVYQRKTFIGEKKIITSLFLSAVFFSVIGIIQFFLGRTTGDLYLIGERTFNLITPGIALVAINGQKLLRAYSTFPHPNALAGFLGAVLFLSLRNKLLKKTWYFFLGNLIVSLGLFLTFSLSVFVGVLFIVIMLMFVRKKKFPAFLNLFLLASILSSLVLPFFSQNTELRSVFGKNIVERLNLSLVSGKMIADKFLLGEGLNTFVVNIPRFNFGIQTTWLLQPVHNIYLLIFAETGIVGLLVLSFFLFKIINHFLQKRKWTYLAVFIFILITSLTDHYWMTIQQNLLFLSLFLGFSLSENSKSG